MSEYPTGSWRPHPAPTPPAPPDPDYEPIHPGSGRRDWRERAKRWGGPIVAALVLVATKLKAVLLLLPKLKIFTTSASMLVSIGAYALIWGWQFAVGLVLLLLVHEMGHVIQLRREGIEASAPMFIPFLGAVVAARSLGDDAAAEARVGLAGPILGTIGTLVPLALWLATGEEFWQALTFIFPNPILILILVIGGYESWQRWKMRKSPEARAYHAIPARTRALVAITYLGLAVALAVGVSESFLEKDFDDV